MTLCTLNFSDGMHVHEYVVESLPDMPWKNGRGTTREIASWPAGSDPGSFCWRASIATIAASAPFSRFDGIDRTILLLAGPGVHLRSNDGRIDHRLDTQWRPFSFAGDVDIECETLGGKSRDFNVMTRRNSHRSETHVLEVGALLDPAPFGLLLGLRGTWQVAAGSSKHVVRPGAGLWWEAGGASSWSLLPDGGVGQLNPALIAVRWLDLES
jgi:uncharacterized protein